MKHLRGVSVVISTYTAKRVGYVLGCIDSLKKQTLEPSEIILVLDRKNLGEFYKDRVPPDVRIMISDGPGICCARNTGIRVAKEEIIAFIDDDAIAHKDWLRNLSQSYDDPEVCCVGGFAEPVWETRRPEWFPEELNWIVGCSHQGLPIKKTAIRNPIGCNMSFRKEVFETVGFFNPKLGKVQGKSVIGEELELCTRISQKFPESKIIQEPSAIVYHKVPNSRTTLKYLFTRSFVEGLSKAVIQNTAPKEINVLSAEDDFLECLLRVSIPSRLRMIYRREKLLQLLAIFFTMFSVFLGYILGKNDM